MLERQLHCVEDLPLGVRQASHVVPLHVRNAWRRQGGRVVRLEVRERVLKVLGCCASEHTFSCKWIVFTLYTNAYRREIVCREML
jgi:hypothetical protein